MTRTRAINNVYIADTLSSLSVFLPSVGTLSAVPQSLAGLRFHFQNASANGHFFVSYEEGGAQPLKKFKACVQPTERSEKCPVPGCTKAFKQAAGLAYHLAHTEGHHMTEREVQTFAATLQSKTRWWYAKLGRQLL